jgi:hypothetical protein
MASFLTETMTNREEKALGEGPLARSRLQLEEKKN